MSNQIGLDVIREFARLSKVELLAIDESTSVVAFESEARANAAYFRLAQGL
jgi:L-arabinose isomerase